MQVSEVNDIKIYNLSHGKTIPEWLSDRKKRLLVKKDVDLRRRIQLIQDFEMPSVSRCVEVSPDGQYILSTGVYKPRVRCYDVNQLAMKFERCFDEEVVKFKILSEDYTKLVFLFVDRYVELHSQSGRYYRIRIPRFGRDMVYNDSTCDLYFVGDSSHVYRLNLEIGSFLKPFDTKSISFNTCAINRYHNLFVCGSHEGMVESFDPRTKSCVGVLDCGLSSVTNESIVDGIPSVTYVTFRDAIHMAVGTATGQILLYDIRSSKPYLVKDHRYGLPIKDIEFIDDLDLIASMDSKIVKLWHRNDGQPYTAIQADSDFNDLCIVPNTGMLFVANEAPKILSYYMPSVGPAPKWCSFLDRITEELEESNENTIYDDYQFVTQKDLEDLGLTHLMGTNLLKAYMHGFFIDIRLYHKAKASSDPFAYEEYKRKKIKEKIESQRADRVNIKSDLPKVNKQLAQRLAFEAQNVSQKSSKKSKPDLLKDDRFKDIFTNPDFEINEQSEDYRLLHPVINKNVPKFQTESKPKYVKNFDEIPSDSGSDNNSDFDEQESESESSDDNHKWTEEVKQNFRQFKEENRNKERESRVTKFYKLKDHKSFANINDMNSNVDEEKTKSTFEERLRDFDANNQLNSGSTSKSGGVYGNRVMTFKVKSEEKNKKQNYNNNNKEEMEKHLLERKQVARRAKGLKFSKKMF
ncbi:nucleolar protein 10-like [Oppia nitens]|uniref:nucleolar protein 10-like n=1 Tax=Oppia nitens TaxID=1686743 RepID=UPI0023DB4F24|nr:nucleolar protein 10-like [Oppia nitens]